ncbi:PaaI family thioesterase [Bacillus sp. ISL-35]|uniref:PaaI family thioesterase n=1 Tax=Bacillus sp. ISL-35 TaxID=2819122 RepID=UPI001BE7EDC2|nr:PaaI family thioesterase [Bacillus sp. ISL-35]MBT2679225.1 PaaI family thioesterase [Bacillus sp. ISL-35]MBT2703121.1 PaaI family thioesterase [Chryseobacterium sp. ISL-80]
MKIKTMVAASDLHKEIENLSSVQKDQVFHVIKALKGSKKELHYTGRLLGIGFEENGEMSMELGMQNANTYDVAQGGALYTLADVAIGFHIMTMIPEDTQVFTLELKMNYVRPGKGKKLYAKPSIIHLGKSTVVSECIVIDEKAETVAIALGTFFLKHKGLSKEEIK